MKSRFLASTTVMVILLLGLVNANLFGQITDPLSVKFYVKAFNNATTPVAIDGAWRSATTIGSGQQDTVGHKVQWKVEWQSGNQADGLTQYAVVLPTGTTITEASLKANGVKITYTDAAQGGSIVNYIPSANITVAGDTVKVLANRNILNYSKFELELLNGLVNPVSVLSANKYSYTTADEQPNLGIFLLNSDDVDNVYADTANFFLKNDLADSVLLNPEVTGFVDNVTWPSNDSLIVLDRFGNFVPDFFLTAGDSLIISVPSGKGNFSATGLYAGAVSIPAGTSDSLVIRYLAASSNVVDGFGAFVASGTILYQQVNSTTLAADRNLENDDRIVIPIYLTGTAIAARPNASIIGVKFDASVTGSLTMTFRIKGKKATGTLAGRTADNMVTATRTIWATGNDAAIGYVTLTMSEVTSKATHSSTKYYNGAWLGTSGGAGSGLTASVTIKDLFGDLHTGTIGTDTDSLLFTFKYVDLTYNTAGTSITAKTVNNTMTTIVQSGKTDIYGTLDRPATKFVGTNFNTSNVLKGGALVSGVFDFSSTTKYLGTASHDSMGAIMVIVSAANNAAACDTAFINVEPGALFTWDVSNVDSILAQGNVVQGAMTPRVIPVYALDTTYNRVSSLNLNRTATSLDGIAIPGYAASNVKALNLLIDGRDPTNYQNDAVADSIMLNKPGDHTTISALATRDSSFLANYTTARSDSSKLDLGNAGLGLILNYTGTRRVSLVYKPGNLGGKIAAADLIAADTVDLGLFKMDVSSSIDSVKNITFPSAGKAGDTLRQVVQFTIPKSDVVLGSNTVDPNTADSLIYIQFTNLPNGGIVTTDSVKVSVDNLNYYSAQASVSSNLLTLKTPIQINANAADVVVYVRIGGFVNPTISDSAFACNVWTSASPVVCHKPSALTVTDNVYGGFVLVPSKITISATIKRASQLSAIGPDTLTAGVAKLFRLLLTDKFGNVSDWGTAYERVIMLSGGPDTTLKTPSNNTLVSQVFSGATTNSSGSRTVDTLKVKADNWGSGYDAVADSIFITMYKAGSYTVTVRDTVSSVTMTQNVALVVNPAALATLTVQEPKGLQHATKNGVVDSTFKVTLTDTYNNAVVDTVHFFVFSGNGVFTQSNGVDIATASQNDSLLVVANSSGLATAKFKAGDSSSITVKAEDKSNAAVTKVSFTVSTEPVYTAATTVNWKVTPHGRIQSTTATQNVQANVGDADKVTKVVLYTVTTEYDTTVVPFVLKATSDTAAVDSVYGVSLDSVLLSKNIPAKAMGKKVGYYVKVTDGAATPNVTTVACDSVYYVLPKLGKRNMDTGVTNVGDLLTCAVLVAQLRTEKVVERFGLNMDGVYGEVDGDDLAAVLAKVRAGTLLASAADQTRSAKVSLGYEAVDKTHANLAINLESQGSLYMSVIRVKYDVSKYVLGEPAASKRIEGVEIVFNNNQQDGIYSVVLVSATNSAILGGEGAILTIPVTAVGDKFDGTGEISILEAKFEGDVSAEVNADVLAPVVILPKEFALSQNYPNPFNPSTTIAYDIPEGKEVQVRLNIYNIRGQLVRTLVDESKSEGSYQIQWDGKDSIGRQVSSGVYFYRIQAGQFSQTRKMVVLK